MSEAGRGQLILALVIFTYIYLFTLKLSFELLQIIFFEQAQKIPLMNLLQ